MDVVERAANRELKPLIVVEEDGTEDDEDESGESKEQQYRTTNRHKRKRVDNGTPAVAVTLGPLSVASTTFTTTASDVSADGTTYKFMEDDGSVGYRVVHIGEVAEGSLSNVSTTSCRDEPPIPTIFTAANPLNGIYVINSSDVFSVNSTTPKGQELPKPSRDDKRRATHNEVERRRRDKINTWIMKLGSIIPECKSESNKASLEHQSKGGILAKACDYITELRKSNERLVTYVKENEQLIADVQSLGRQCEDLTRENQTLRSLLAKHGISPPL